MITPINVRRIPSSRPSPRSGGEKETEPRFDYLTLSFSRTRASNVVDIFILQFSRGWVLVVTECDGCFTVKLVRSLVERVLLFGTGSADQPCSASVFGSVTATPQGS